ncbi:MAG: DNA alkylation repair protein [Candidatus Aenigmarchaeota archaeon]|nr:DNA alkylation repair protein [Candidatus Aenigmarchaeota archaeon]
MTLKNLRSDMKKLSNSEKAKLYSRYFKTGKGEYGEGDIFIGLTVPEQRKLSKEYKGLSLNDIQELLKSKIHEERLTGLLILVLQYKKADEKLKGKIVEMYLSNTKNINNWDLVDLSAPNIPGDYFLKRERSFIYKLSKSKNLWEKRIAVLSTFAFIKNEEFDDSLKIAEILMNDKHDLIHKAVGWMLREIGKKDQFAEEKFLKKYHKAMPRTMLRYAIEKFNSEKREVYLRK